MAEPRIQKQIFFRLMQWENVVRAAEIAGTNTTSFIREAALEKADKIILTEEEGK